jgi:hypothetical protein
MVKGKMERKGVRLMLNWGKKVCQKENIKKQGEENF